MLPQFFHCKSPLEPGTDYILCTRPPFYIGKVIQFKNDQSVYDFIEVHQPFLGRPVPGYNILIVFAGSLNNQEQINKVEFNSIFSKMAEAYLERIKQREQRYKRYKTEA